MTKQQPSLDRIFIVDATQDADGQYRKADEMVSNLKRRVPEGGGRIYPYVKGSRRSRSYQI